MVSFNDVLIAAKEYCKNQMVDATYRLYIEKLQLVSFEDSSIITLSIENEFLCGIVNDRYLTLLRDAFKSVLGFEAEVRVVSPEEPAAPPLPEAFFLCFCQPAGKAAQRPVRFHL